MSLDDIKDDLAQRLQDIERANRTLMPLILERVESLMAGMEHWSGDPYWKGGLGIHMTHVAQLEGFVDLLEAFDCGSCGGYGKGYSGGPHLKPRAQWLLEKYR